MSRPARTVLLIVLALAVLAVLFTVVFPWVDRAFLTDPTLGG